MTNQERPPAEQGTAGAHQGPTGAREDARPVGPLAHLHNLADLWDIWAAEAGTLAGLLTGAVPPEDVRYVRGQAAGHTECAVQLRNLLGRLEDEQAAAQSRTDTDGST